MRKTERERQGTVIARGSVLENTRFYMGSLMSFLATSEDTSNAFNLLEYRSAPGMEPPPHIHLNQDELLYILDGEILSYTPLETVQVRAGESIFLPRNVAHTFDVISPKLSMLIFNQPGGLDTFFDAMSVPASSMDLPTGAATYKMDDPAHVARVGLEHGIRILSPAEAKELLPKYPGFGSFRTSKSED